MDGGRACWTEERHSHYLNWIEASFVSRMLGGGCVGVRLDRHIPDSDTESTGDSRTCSPAARHVVDSEIAVGRENKGCSRRKRARYDASPEQVVPVFEGCEDDDAGVSIKRKRRRGGI